MCRDWRWVKLLICLQGYCGLEQVALTGRLDSREDVATAVAAAINPAALHASLGTPLGDILRAAGPSLGPQVLARHLKSHRAHD